MDISKLKKQAEQAEKKAEKAAAEADAARQAFEQADASFVKSGSDKDREARRRAVEDAARAERLAAMASQEAEQAAGALADAEREQLEQELAAVPVGEQAMRELLVELGAVALVDEIATKAAELRQLQAKATRTLADRGNQRHRLQIELRDRFGVEPPSPSMGTPIESPRDLCRRRLSAAFEIHGLRPESAEDARLLQPIGDNTANRPGTEPFRGLMPLRRSEAAE